MRAALLIAFLPLLLGTSPCNAAETVTSTQLLKDPSQSFTRATEAQALATSKQLPENFSAGVYLKDADYAWYLHKGDLVIDGNFVNEHALIIDGNLTVKGDFDDYRGNFGLLIVLGDLKVDDAYSWGTVSVRGSVEATGVFFADYNDFVFDASRVKASALIISDKSGSVGPVQANIYRTSWDTPSEATVRATLRYLEPELLAPHILSVLEDGAEAVLPDSQRFRKRMAAGRSLIRSEPGPETLDEDLLQAAADEVTDEDLLRLLARDRLLAATIAQRPGLTQPVKAALLATRDELVLEMLAGNTSSDAELLREIVKRSPSLGALVLANPNAGDDLLLQGATDAPDEAREAIAKREHLPDALVHKLVKDASANVRGAIIWRHGHRLSAAELTQLARDPDPEVRQHLLRRDHLHLTFEMIAPLADDPSEEVKEALGEHLTAEAVGERLPGMSLAERRTLAERLLRDVSPAVRRSAVGAAAPIEQLNAIDAWRKDRQVSILREVAKSTPSRRLQADLASHQDVEVRKALAANRTLAPDNQLKLLNTLAPAAKRNYFNYIDNAAWNRANDGAEGVIRELVQNPNATAAALEKSASYCAATAGNAVFCNEFAARFDLLPEHVEPLRHAYAGEERKNIALTILLHVSHASREQVVWAINAWHDDDVRRALAALEPLAGDDFWRALAKSENHDLQEAAARNIHTPPDALDWLMAHDDPDEPLGAESNPRLGAEKLDALLDSDKAPALLFNPAIDEGRVRTLLARALASDDMSLADACVEWLAPRGLRGAYED